MTTPDPTRAAMQMALEAQRQKILVQIDHCAALAYAAGHHFAEHGKHAPSSVMSKADADATLIRLIDEYAALRASLALPAEGAPDEARRAVTRAEVLSDVDPVVLECWKLQGRKVGAMLREAQTAVIELQEQLDDAKEAVGTAALPAEGAEPVEAQGEFTYASKQATNCARCGQHKHTPLRVDKMDGYVCLTCIDEELERLLDAEGAEPPAPAGWWTEELERIWNATPGQRITANMKRAAAIALRVARGERWDDAKHEWLAATPHPPQGRGAAGEGGERGEDALTQREVDAIYALRHAADWIASAPHGDNCFVSSHYEGDPGDRCNCGKDSAEQAIHEALGGYPESMDDDGEPLELIAGLRGDEAQEGGT